MDSDRRAGLLRLLASLPQRGAADIDRAVLVREYASQIAACPWITDAVWDRAVTTMIRTEAWFPPVVTLLRVCAEVEREIVAEAGRAVEEYGRDDTLPAWLTDADRPALRPNTLHAAIARGEWDRAWVHAALVARRRREYAHERQSHWRIALGPRSARDKSLAIIAAGAEVAVFVPVVTVADVDDELRRMSAIPTGTKGALKGPLDAALRFRLPVECD